MYVHVYWPSNMLVWYMWQSRVEIEYYSVVYFICITAFEVSAVTQYFHHGWGSYVLCKLMNTRYIYKAVGSSKNETNQDN